MHFPTLLAQCDPPAALRGEVTGLMMRKSVTRELGTAPLSPVVAGFIDAEFELARGAFEAGQASASEEVVAQAEHFYRMVVERLERESDAARALRTGLELPSLAQSVAGSA